MKVTNKSNTRSISDFSFTRRKISRKARSNVYKIFSIKRFKKKIDYAVFCDNDLDIPKISCVDTRVINSNQPFRRRVTKSVFIKATQLFPLSMISMRKQNYD